MAYRALSSLNDCSWHCLGVFSIKYEEDGVRERKKISKMAPIDESLSVLRVGSRVSACYGKLGFYTAVVEKISIPSGNGEVSLTYVYEMTFLIFIRITIFLVVDKKRAAEQFRSRPRTSVID